MINNEKYIQPTKKYSYVIKEVNDLLKPYKIKLLVINKRYKEFSAPIFYDMVFCLNYIQSNAMSDGFVRLKYEDISYGVFAVEGLLGPEINQIMSEVMNLPRYPRFFHARDIDKGKLLFTFEYQTTELKNPLIHIRVKIDGIIRVISEYIVNEYQEIWKKLDAYRTDLSAIKPFYNDESQEKSSSMSGQILKFYNQINSKKKLKPLSKKQQEIAWLVYLGYPMKKIALKLDLSEATVVSYLNIIKAKLNLFSKSDLAEFVNRNPFILSDENIRKIMFGGV